MLLEQRILIKVNNLRGGYSYKNDFPDRFKKMLDKFQMLYYNTLVPTDVGL